MRILHLYRPRLPDTRAQSIQVFRTCHALAEAGHEVSLFANKGPRHESLWKQMGLPPHKKFRLHVSPVRQHGLSGMWFRRCIQQWWAGEPGVILARDKLRLMHCLRKHGKGAHNIILETHELDSLHPGDQVDAKQHQLEEDCLSVADALVANCGGTLDAWREYHSVHISNHICHNASHIQIPPATADQKTVMVVGSMRETKGVKSILDAATDLDIPFRWIGGTNQERERWNNGIQLEAPVPHAHIEAVLMQAKVLLLPLGNNAFSQRFTSPLKLWDYLATDRPIVAADTPAVAEICRKFAADIFAYEPENRASIQRAILRALRAPRRSPIRRTWKQRAEELSQIMAAIK